MTDTSIRLSTANRQDLKRLMPDTGETYDEVISNLRANQMLIADPEIQTWADRAGVSVSDYLREAARQKAKREDLSE